MPRQRSQKRNNYVGTYVTDELKAKTVRDANTRGMNISDYVRFLLTYGDKLEDPEKREK